MVNTNVRDVVQSSVVLSDNETVVKPIKEPGFKKKFDMKDCSTRPKQNVICNLAFHK